MRRISVGTVLIFAGLLAFIVAAVGADLFAGNDPLRQSLLLRLRPPGTATAAAYFPLGTDDLGRDLLARILYGARASLLVAALSVSVSLLVGVTLGLIAGWFGGWVSIVAMRAVDTMLSIPAILLAVLTVAVLGPGFINLVLVLGLTRWPRYTRVAYAQTLQVAALPYVRAAEMAGCGPGRILLRHVLPNIAGPLMVVATSEFGLMILFEASLSFLGLGIQPPTPDLGSMVTSGAQFLPDDWWESVLPGCAILFVALGFNLLGDGLRDLFDVQDVR